MIFANAFAMQMCSYTFAFGKSWLDANPRGLDSPTILGCVSLEVYNIAHDTKFELGGDEFLGGLGMLSRHD